jgi:hypothetical protein
MFFLDPDDSRVENTAQDVQKSLACGSGRPPTPSCQVSVSVWNYYLLNNISSRALSLVISNGTQMMTVQQYLAARTATGM